jgi:hypothetical protein
VIFPPENKTTASVVSVVANGIQGHPDDWLTPAKSGHSRLSIGHINFSLF